MQHYKLEQFAEASELLWQILSKPTQVEPSSAREKKRSGIGSTETLAEGRGLATDGNGRRALLRTRKKCRNFGPTTSPPVSPGICRSRNW